MTMLESFLKEVETKERSVSTMRVLIFALNEAQEIIGKPLHTADWNDILNYIRYEKNRNSITCQIKGQPIVERKLASNTISIRASKLRQFYRYCLDETDEPKYNKLIKKLRDFSKLQNKSINPQDLLTPEEIKKLINVATLERDRCIVATLFESGMRIGELLSLKTSMIQMDEEKQEIIFHIPDEKGCKTGSRSVLCFEIYGYVQDWLKCKSSENFFDISFFGVRKMLIRLFNKAGIEKPCNPHNFRHSAITNWVALGMQPNQISMRAWGIPNSNMLATYIHLNEQIQADGYRNAKGMGNTNGNTIINPLASRCVNCGRLIQSGNLCKPCDDSKKLSYENESLKAQIQKNQEENEIIMQVNRDIIQQQDEMKKQMDFITAAIQAKEAK